MLMRKPLLDSLTLLARTSKSGIVTKGQLHRDVASRETQGREAREYQSRTRATDKLIAKVLCLVGFEIREAKGKTSPLVLCRKLG